MHSKRARRLPRAILSRSQSVTDASRPDYETLIALADFYDVSLDEIFDRDKPR